MEMRTRLGLPVASAVIAAMLAAPPVRAQALPEGVTQDMIEKGKAIFTGAGNCYACHGQNAEGMLGPTTKLVDHQWIHSDGSYNEIVKYITTGVTKEQSKSGIPMPPRGGAKITDEQVKQVAAYVWSISRKK